MRFNRILNYISLLLIIIIIGYLYKNSNSFVKSSVNNEDSIKEFLINNPETIIQSLEQYQLKKQGDRLEKAKGNIKDKKKDLYGDLNDPKIGNPNSKVKIVEFFDYNCGYCKRAFETISKIAAEDKDVLIVFKELPILSKDSFELSKAALAVNIIAPDKYYQFHSILMKDNTPKTKEFLESEVKKLSIDLRKYNEVKESAKITSIFEANHQLAQSIGLQGVPMFIIGEELITSSLSYQELKNKINEQRTKN